jgi:hypothetical protein
MCVICSVINLLAIDSVVIQTFTFDSIICRQAHFQFPNKDEKFNKVIGKYRLKCDPKTQHDAFNCGEWDYHAYLRILKPSNLDSIYTPMQFPATTFGNAYLQDGDNNRILSKQKVIDKWQVNFYHTNISSSNEKTIAVSSGDTILRTFSNHQFILLPTDLKNAGLKENDKIGKLIMKANIVDTLKNVVVRMANYNYTVLLNYTNTGVDTVLLETYITPDECVNGKLTLNFMEDFVWNGTQPLLIEIICDDNTASNNEFYGKYLKQKCAITGSAFNYAVFGGNNSWIDVNVPDIATKLREKFTIEGWFKVNSADSITLENAVLFSIGDKFAVKLGNSDNKHRIYIEKFNEQRQLMYTDDINAFKYDVWQHIAVVFDSKGTINPERMQIYLDGNSIPLRYEGWGVEGAAVFPALDSTIAHFTIGDGYTVDAPRQYFKGGVTNVRVWNTSLTASEILFSMANSIDATNTKYENLLIDGSVETFANINSSIKCNVIGNIYFETRNEGIIGSRTTNFIPDLQLVVGDFTYDNNVQVIQIEKWQVPTSVVNYDTTNKDFPTVANVDYYYVPEEKLYDIEGNVISTTPLSIPTENITVGTTKYTFNKRNRTQYHIFEIARFITPYGINLSLGKDGFEWEYDLTDYMHELRGDVIIAAHNWQELIDMKFIFYKGAPIRDVLRISEPWGQTHNTSYLNLINDKEFSEAKVVKFLPETKSVKLKTRITGHGMNSGNNSSIQCCEFYDNTHYLEVGTTADNMEPLTEWHIWRQCTDNAVYPQGGTWMLAREGWCPGYIVKEYDWELTQHIKSDSLRIDYNITPTAYQKDKETGNGYYTMGMQVVEYGESKYSNDLELYKVMCPSTEDMMSRINPICNGIKFVVRNNTDKEINLFTFVIEAENHIYLEEITKTLLPFVLDTITIFIDGDAAINIWKAASYMDKPEVKISLLNPNGTEDDNLENNVLTQSIVLPDILDKNNLILKYLTNLRPGDYKLTIFDNMGEEVKSLKGSSVNKEYIFKFNDLENGCYTFEIEDINTYLGTGLGLSYWNYPGQGNGRIGFYDSTAKKGVKVFNPDFGKKITYSFVLNSFSSVREDEKIALSVYPNPTSSILNIQLFENINNAKIDIYDISGNIVATSIKNITENNVYDLDISKLNTGSYSVRITNGKRTTWSKFIKK